MSIDEYLLICREIDRRCAAKVEKLLERAVCKKMWFLGKMMRSYRRSERHDDETAQRISQMCKKMNKTMRKRSMMSLRRRLAFDIRSICVHIP